MRPPRLEITVNNKKYYFNVEEFHRKPVPPNTVIVISERIRVPDPMFDVFQHIYVAVDEGFTSSNYMIHPLKVGMNYCILSATIEDKEERQRVVDHFKHLADKTEEFENHC